MKRIIISIIMLFQLQVAAQMQTVKWERVADNLNFPEGPAWNNSNSFLVFSNCYGDWLGKISEAEADTFISAPSSPFEFKSTNGTTFDSRGNLYVCDFGKGAVIKFTPDKKCYAVAEKYKDKKFNRPNDLAFSPDGELFFTDPKSNNPDSLDGAIYKINLKGEVVKLDSGLAFPNGIAFSRNGDELFVCESALHRIIKYKFTEEGNLTMSEVFAKVPGGEPDGIAFDVKGNLYAAHFGGSAVIVLAPDGKIITKIKTPGKNPSNVEFGGNEMTELYITEDETNAVYRTKMEIPGFKLFNESKFDN